MAGRRKAAQRKATDTSAPTAATKASGNRYATKHADPPSHSIAKTSAAAVSDCEYNSMEFSAPMPTQPLGTGHEATYTMLSACCSATKRKEDNGTSEGKLVFYGTSVCQHCGDRGHAATGCSTPFCMSCDVWGHAKGQCADACERCGRVHERRDGICRAFCCQICGLFGHRPNQCPSCLCGACGCYGHSSSRCPSSRTCPLCGELGHPQTDCPLLCNNCGYPGHKTVDCMFKQCEQCNLFGHVAAECLFTGNTAAAETEQAVHEDPAKEALATTVAASASTPSCQASAACTAGASTFRQPPACTGTEAACSSGRPDRLTIHSVPHVAAGSTPAGNQSAPAGHTASAPLTAAPIMQAAVANPAYFSMVAEQPGTKASARGPPPGFQPRPTGFCTPALPGLQHHGAPPQQPPVPLPDRLMYLPPGGFHEQCPHQQHAQAQQAPSIALFTPPSPSAAPVIEPSENEEIEEMLGLLGV